MKKIPEGQEYAPRLEPAAPIRLADRNHVHYPSRQLSITPYIYIYLNKLTVEAKRYIAFKNSRRDVDMT